MVGNLIIILSSNQLISYVGCYIYYIGLDWVVITLLRFTANYCDIPYVGTRWRVIANSIVAIDVVQLLLNPVTHHAFYTTPIMVDGALYFSLVPLLGQMVHRVVAYGIFFVSLGLITYKVFKASRIYMERYLVIQISMIVCGLWESYYIFSGTPVDRSMMGFGFFGLLVFYFALHYRPVRLLDRMLARIVSGMNAGVFFFDTTGKCIYGNDLAREYVDMGDAVDIPDSVVSEIAEKIGGWNGRFNEDWTAMRQVGEGDGSRFLDIRVQQLRDEKGHHIGASMTVRDATDENNRLKNEQYLASHDSLTGILNKRALYDRIREELDAHPDVSYKVVGIDIKDFKIINDIYSKEFGDKVLQTVAKVLTERAPDSSVFGRLTGDKFGLLIPTRDFSNDRMERLLTEASFGKMTANYPIIVHMGVYEVLERDLLVSVMFDRAFMAISSIKSDFKRHVAEYDDAMRDDLVWNQSISTQLDRAIKERQVQPYLQPMVDKQGRVEGAEVLVRWIHPEEGFLSPARFIPVFEKNGMIAQLDAYMWECACEILRNWADRGIDLFLSVNISPKDFYFIDVYGTISGLVAKYGIDPARLRLEITETVMMTDLENRLRIIENLRSDGFLVEMDDFGSGYSSLNMLKDIPVDVLKIDMMFLYKTKDQAKAETILQTIIDLSGQLGIRSITEGVETAEQLDMLVNMGCRMFQGYYFAKPMPVAEFEETYHRAA